MTSPDNPLLLKWASKTLTDEEYLALVQDIAAMSHNDLAFVISKPIQDNLRGQIREELIVRSIVQSPREKTLIQAALWLGILSAIASILPFLSTLLRYTKHFP